MVEEEGILKGKIIYSPGLGGSVIMKVQFPSLKTLLKVGVSLVPGRDLNIQGRKELPLLREITARF